MNTKDDWKTTAVIMDPERLELWGEVFPDGVVPIVSIMPQRVSVSEKGDVDVYMLDLNALKLEQLTGVISTISKKFGIPFDEVRSEINRGVPILVEVTSAQCSDPGVFFSMIDDLRGELRDIDDEEDEVDWDEEDWF